MNKLCTVYYARPMTGYDKGEMVAESLRVYELGKKYGLEVWCPVLHEKIEGKGNLENSKTDLDWKWPLDKQALNNCFVFVWGEADKKSFGCEDEYGRQRYSEWQPSFRISPKHAAGYISIGNYQSDGICGDEETCFKYIIANFGTKTQRRIWKIKLWFRSGLPWLWRQIKRVI